MIAARQAETRIVSELRRQRSLGDVQLDQARREARFSGLPLVEILLARDMISDEDVARVYAEQNGLRYLDLSRRSISDAWALTIPENVARRKMLLPLGEVNGELIVAMGDPADRTALNVEQRRYDSPVHLVVSPRYQIRQCQERVYPQARQRGVQVVRGGDDNGFDLAVVQQLLHASGGPRIVLGGEFRRQPLLHVHAVNHPGELRVQDGLGSIDGDLPAPDEPVGDAF